MENHTPQQQVDNMVAGIKNTYQVVAKRHVHPWYSWALLAAAIGFTVGVAYVANQNAKFEAGHAEEMVASSAYADAVNQMNAGREAVDAPIAVAPGQVIPFVSDGTEKVAVFVPTVTKIQKDDDGGWIEIAAAVAVIIIGVPNPLDFIGEAAGSLVGSIIGAPASFFTTLVTGATSQIIDSALYSNVPLPIFSAQSPIIDKLNEAIGAKDKITSGIAVYNVLKNAAVSQIDVTAQKENDEIDARTELLLKNIIKKEQGVGNSTALNKRVDAQIADVVRVLKKGSLPLLGAGAPKDGRTEETLSVIRIAYNAKKWIAVSELRYNPVLAVDRINSLSTFAQARMNTIWQSVYDGKRGKLNGDALVDYTEASISGITTIGQNKDTSAVLAMQEKYNGSHNDTYITYNKLTRNTVVLPGTKKAWGGTLPGSQWVSFRDTEVKGPRQNTIMGVAKTFTLPSGEPTEGILAFIGTDTRVQVMVNGVRIYANRSANKKTDTSKATILDITKYLIPGDNKIVVYEVQASETSKPFGIDFAGYVSFAQ